MTIQIQTTDFYLKQKEPEKSCFLALRSIILACNTNISEAVKYGMPCFLLNGKAMCYLWKDKKTLEPYILFVEGNSISHHELQSGNRAKMKILPIKINEDIPQNLITELLGLSIEVINQKG